MTPVVRWTGRQTKALRQARRLSIRAFAEHLGVAMGSVVNWERRGEQVRLRGETQEILDRDLSMATPEVLQRFQAAVADPSAVAALGEAAPDVEDAGIPVPVVQAQAVTESESLLTGRTEGVDFEFLCEAAHRLGASYVMTAPGSMLRQALSLRRELRRRLKSEVLRPGQVADSYVAIGRACGVLAYAALDLGDPVAAATHGAAAWHMAEIVGDNDLRGWVRGTQSLVARFSQDFVRADLFAEAGLRYARAGASKSRLICAAAQSAANQGDATRAAQLITAAQRASEAGDPDASPGIFGFSLAKQKYYVASSLIWSSDKRSLSTAANSAVEAIELWRREPDKECVLDDEVLAYVYLAIARLKLGEIDGALEAVSPVLNLPAERKTAWMRRRVANLRELLAQDRYRDSDAAVSARQDLHEFEVG